MPKEEFPYLKELLRTLDFYEINDFLKSCILRAANFDVEVQRIERFHEGYVAATEKAKEIILSISN